MERAGPVSPLRARLAAGGFAVTAELGPPRGAQTAGLRAQAGALREHVDAVNITDNQSSFVRLASWAGSLAVLAEGVSPVMQVACRDRNRIALQSDLLSAAAYGVTDVLVLTGDHPRHGDHADATPVFDLDSLALLAAARTMRDEGRLLSGERLDPAPELFLGAVDNPVPGAGADRLAQKVAAGAQFVQTQFVYDVPQFAAWLAEARDRGLLKRCHVLAGVGPIRSLRGLERMRQIPGLRIPDAVEARLRAVPAERVGEEGRRVCIEIIEQLRGLDGVAGVHVMAIGQESVVPELLERAGLGRAADRAGGPA